MRRVLCIALLAIAATAHAVDLRLADVFTDHAVLQRDQPIRVWGWAAAQAPVRVILGAGKTVKVSADAQGRWVARLPARSAGGPHALRIESGGARIVLGDILIGDVWLASGQSNMQWSVSSAVDAAAEIAAADWPRIRLFTVPNTTAYTPQSDVDGAWRVCRPGTIGAFSAVAYFFGRQLHRELGVPIGLINSSWGGTRIEPWIDAAGIDGLVEALPATDAAVVTNALQRRDATRGDAVEQQLRWAASRTLLQEAEADRSHDAEHAGVDVDDGDWSEMAIPNQWETAGLEGFDGMVWFRRHLEIPAAWAGRDLVLHLGPVDEADVTFFNGVEIGATGSYTEGVSGYWDDARVYTIPGDLVRAGAAVLAVRAIDMALAGGLWGSPAEEMFLAPADASAGEGLAIAGTWRYRPGPQLVAAPPAIQQLPSTLYHAMIHPLVPLSLRGAIWYQGESNLVEGAAYAEKMVALIGSWRRRFLSPDMPFYFAQLAPYRYGNPEALPVMWEAQASVPERVPGVGMAVVNDVGNVDDIHPTDKQTVGFRLASLALKHTYGRKVTASGPVLAGVEREGAALRVRFSHAEGLGTRDGEPPSHFEIAGADGEFVAAEARIDGESVVLRHPSIAAPTRVRFAWHEEAEPNLVNGAGWPASAFRSR